MTAMGDPLATFAPGRGDQYVVCRYFKDDHCDRQPGDIVTPEDAARWSDSAVRTLKASLFIRPEHGAHPAWRALRAFRVKEGAVSPGMDIPTEWSDAWPERTAVLFEKQGLIEGRTVDTPESAIAVAPEVDTVKAAFIADEIVKPAPKPRKKRGPYKKRAKKVKE